jgi:hypothetical protein
VSPYYHHITIHHHQLDVLVEQLELELLDVLVLMVLVDDHHHILPLPSRSSTAI